MQQIDSKGPPGQEQQQTTEEILYPQRSYQHFEDDTINLYEMLMTIWKNKWIIITITIVAALGSIIYVLNLPRIYKTEALLLPPQQKDFQSINLLDIQDSILDEKRKLIKSSLNSEDIFNKFKQNLKSRSIQKQFIKENNLIELLNYKGNSENENLEFYKSFAKMFSITETNGITHLYIEMNQKEIASNLINSFIEFVDKATINILIADLNGAIKNQIREIEYNISSKRLMAEKRRQDQIVRYSENAAIAKELGMIGRVDATNIIQSTQGTEMDSATTPLYYLGYEALMTEIKILRNRKSDDPFIIGLRDLEEKLELLQKIKIDKEKMSTVYIDQPAFPPKYPIKPKARLIVSLATLVAFFSVILLVFSIEFIKSQKKKHS